MPQEEKVYKCKNHINSRCRRDAREQDEFDPRSFCHNICATPKNICGTTICEKFISVGPNDEKQVCIPTRICKVIRHFGPEAESYPKDGKKPLSAIESEESEDDDAKAELQKPLDLKTKLVTLKQTVNREDMAAIYALAGNEICPCCGCKICVCELRKTISKKSSEEKQIPVVETLFTKTRKTTDLKQMLSMKSSKDKRSVKRTLHPAKSMEAIVLSTDKEQTLSNSPDQNQKRYEFEELSVSPNQLQNESKENIGRKSVNQLENTESDLEKSYGYSFDYYNDPDLETYDKLKKLKEEEEIEEEIKREELSRKAVQKKGEKEKEEIDSAELAEMEVQASPETKEKENGEEQRTDLIDEFSEVTSFMDKIEGWKKQAVDDKAWVEYKDVEWAGVRTQEKYSVLESKVLADVKEEIEQKKMPVSDAIEASHIAPPLVDLRLLPFDQRWLDEKISTIPSPSDLQKTLEEEPISSTKIAKPVLEPSMFDPKLGTLSSMPVKTKTVEKSKEITESNRLDEESAQLTAKDGKIILASAEDNDEYLNILRKEYLMDICECLPGFCICGEGHYMFRKKRSDRTEQADKMVPSSSCSCIHSSEETLVTPVVSRLDVVASPPPQIYEPPIEKNIIRLMGCPKPAYQKTLVIVKPEAVRYKDVIFRAIYKEGLDIVKERLVQLTPEQVAEIYFENFGSAYFPLFVTQLSSSPVLAIIVAGTNAVQRWNTVVGPDKGIPVSWFYPDSMRRRFSVNEDINDAMKLSDDFQKAKTEIRYFFPFDIIDPIIIGSTMIQDYCDEFIHPTLLEGLYILLKTKPADPIHFLAEWLLLNNPFQPSYKQKEISLTPT